MTETGLPPRSLLRVGEVADHFQVTPETVYSWIAIGRLVAVRPGPRTLRISRESVEALTRPVDPEEMFE